MIDLDNRQILLLSPHYDDVVFSLGGLLPRLQETNDCQVINLFSKSNFINEGIAELDAATKQRSQEDRQALSGLGIQNISYAEFEEAMVRGLTREELFRTSLPGDHDSISMINYISNYLREYSESSVLVAPCGFGGHIDHLITRAAVESLERETFFYMDLPYASCDTTYKHGVGQAFVVDKTKTTCEITNEQIDLHLSACKQYRTQFLPRFSNEIGGALRTFGYTLWH